MTKNQEKVKEIMAIWKQFCQEHGGRDRLSANVLWSWPSYLRARLEG